jgi:hypothetical protein
VGGFVGTRDNALAFVIDDQCSPRRHPGRQ